jgi:hypothetical protein
VNHVVLIGDLDEGVAFSGPFASKEKADAWLAASGARAHCYCEVLPLLQFPTTPAGDEDTGPHVLVVGSFAEGFTIYGPFASLEHAEENSGNFPTEVMLMPLSPVA